MYNSQGIVWKMLYVCKGYLWNWGQMGLHGLVTDDHVIRHITHVGYMALLD